MAASVPDSDSLRRAALQASWQRGRWVARRRLWWRWSTWALLRIVLPVAAVLGLIGGLAYGWSVVTNVPGPVRAVPPVKPPAVPTLTPAATPPTVEPDPALAPAGSASLRLDWAVAPRNSPKNAPTPAPSPASAPTTNVGDSRP